MHEWLLQHGVDPVFLDRVEFPIHKPPALVTLDDRAIGFTGEFPPHEALEKFRPWNDKEV